MSATFGDINNDCHLDIYTAGIHSSQRWYRQAATIYQYLLTSIRQGTIFEDFPLYRELSRLTGPFWGAIGIRTVKGNHLLLNDGSGKFSDVAVASEANPLGWYWSSAMFDYDNDGRQDIYTVNGWVTAKNKEDL
jgi:VCBS repeat protein